jgi:hypothetical protein
MTAWLACAKILAFHCGVCAFCPIAKRKNDNKNNILKIKIALSVGLERFLLKRDTESSGT